MKHPLITNHMRLAFYHKLALRTESPKDLGIGLESSRLLHAALGICTEAAELVEAGDSDVVLIKEECGDVFWYINVACDVFGTTIDELEWQHHHVNEDLLDGMVILSGEFSDLIKRCLFYGEEVDTDKALVILAKLVKHIIEYIDEFSIDLEDMLDSNIDKLKVRFPEQFCTEKALNRNLIKERRTLEL